MPKAKIGVIGGSGLYKMAGLTEVEEARLSTPFGDPSDAFFIGTLAGERVAFLPRHGRGHTLLPTEIPFRANIYAMKLLGVERMQLQHLFDVVQVNKLVDDAVRVAGDVTQRRVLRRRFV